MQVSQNVKKITVSDIAAFAGVSSATVSRVINHRELVKAQTIKSVEDAMMALGVYPKQNSVHESYSRNIIVLNVQDIKNTFYQQIMDGANISAKSHGCDLIITQSSLKKDRIPDFIRLLKNVKASGVILLSALPAQSLDAIAHEFPIVQCSEYNPGVKPAVCFNKQLRVSKSGNGIPYCFRPGTKSHF